MQRPFPPPIFFFKHPAPTHIYTSCPHLSIHSPGLIFCWTYIGLLAIPGLILSIVGMSQKNRSKGLGIAGLILSAIALCIWLIVLAAIGIAVL